MTDKERLAAALTLRQPDDKVPHFELVFQLTEEQFGPRLKMLDGETLKSVTEGGRAGATRRAGSGSVYLRGRAG